MTRGPYHLDVIFAFYLLLRNQKAFSCWHEITIDDPKFSDGTLMASEVTLSVSPKEMKAVRT
jgi:hypothetical protein